MSDDPTPTDPALPAWATPAIVELLEKTLAVEIDAVSQAVDELDPTRFAEIIVAALVDEDLVIIPDQHVDVERYVDDAREHRWRALDDQNGQTVAASGEGYVSTTHCAHMVERLFPTANTTTKENPTT